MLYVSLLWPCLLLTLGYLSSFFLAERKLRWPSLPLLLPPLTPQLICTQVTTAIPFPLLVHIFTTSQPINRHSKSRSNPQWPIDCFLIQSSVTTFCHLHGFCKGLWVMTKWRQGKKRSILRKNRTFSFRPETECVSGGYARHQYHYAATYRRKIWTAMTASFHTLAPTWALLVTSEKKATEELRGVPVYATMWPKNISLDITSAMANGLNSYKSWACAVRIHNK